MDENRRDEILKEISKKMEEKKFHQENLEKLKIEGENVNQKIIMEKIYIDDCDAVINELKNKLIMLYKGEA